MGSSALGVLIYRLEKGADVNYLPSIVSECVLQVFTTGKDSRRFFSFNCVDILSALLEVGGGGEGMGLGI